MNPDHRDTGARTVGRYEILRRIGQGGMATVYLARQPRLDREVALKELDRFGIADQVVFRSRFVREAKLAASLNHANIVTVLDYFEHDDRPYIAMEYLEGGSLRDYLGELSLAQIMGVLEGLLAGLTHAEDREIAHRDIKPENILVTQDGKVKLTDFGIARAYTAALSVLTVKGTTVGTPKYMAPEQGTGGALSARTDLYAVGIVAYEMLVGHVPFDSEENALAIVWQHVHDPLPDPREARPDLDPRICRWLEELLRKDPADRPPSARAALDALEELIVDLLGPHWRRAARLPAPNVAHRGPRPLTPARVVEVSYGHDVPEGIRLEDEADDDVGDVTLAPRAAASRTAAFRKALDARGSVAEPTPATPRRAPRPAEPRALRAPLAKLTVQRRRLLTLITGLAVVVLVGVYALASGDSDPGPQTAAPAVPLKAVLAARGERQRFVTSMRTVFERFERDRSPAMRALGGARTGPGQRKTARAVGQVYRNAAADLAKLAPETTQARMASRVRVQLRRVARWYERLGAAAKGHQPKRYAAARKAIAAGDVKLNGLVADVPA